MSMEYGVKVLNSQRMRYVALPHSSLNELLCKVRLAISLNITLSLGFAALNSPNRH